MERVTLDGTTAGETRNIKILFVCEVGKKSTEMESLRERERERVEEMGKIKRMGGKERERERGRERGRERERN